MKVAYFSPLPPERSGIADYSALLLPALEERVEVAVASRGAKRLPRGADVALYHMGNNPEAHGWIYDVLRRHRGVVVLHDFVLHHLVAGVTLGRGDSDGYLDAMQRDSGVVGRLLAHGVVDELLPPLWEGRAQDFPLAGAILDLADGVICHSRFVEQKAREHGYTGPLWVVPMPAWPAFEPGPSPLPEGRSPVIGCFGHLNAAKRIPQVLEAFQRLHRRFPEALLVLAGSAAPRFELVHPTVDEGVLRLDYQDEERLWELLGHCDVSVNLRWPTMGETSGMVVRALSLGVPLVVSDAGSFSELPDSVAVKVPVDELEVETLTAVLERLAVDGAVRERMSAAARELAVREHNVEHVANLYTAALEESVGGPAVRDAVLGEVAREAHEIGIESIDPEVAEVAGRARELGLGP